MVRWGVNDCRAVELLSLKLSVYRRKQSSSANPQYDCRAVVNAFREYEDASDLATGKFAAEMVIRVLRIHRYCKSTVNIDDATRMVVEKSALRQENPSACNWNGAASDNT